MKLLEGQIEDLRGVNLEPSHFTSNLSFFFFNHPLFPNSLRLSSIRAEEVTKPEFISLFVVRVNWRLRLEYLFGYWFYQLVQYMSPDHLVCARFCGMLKGLLSRSLLLYGAGRKHMNKNKALSYLHFRNCRPSWVGQRGSQHRGKAHLVSSISLTSGDRGCLKVLVHGRVDPSFQVEWPASWDHPLPLANWDGWSSQFIVRRPWRLEQKVL